MVPARYTQGLGHGRRHATAVPSASPSVSEAESPQREVGSRLCPTADSGAPGPNTAPCAPPPGQSEMQPGVSEVRGGAGHTEEPSDKFRRRGVRLGWGGRKAPPWPQGTDCGNAEGDRGGGGWGVGGAVQAQKAATRVYSWGPPSTEPPTPASLLTQRVPSVSPHPAQGQPRTGLRSRSQWQRAESCSRLLATRGTHALRLRGDP